MAKLYWRLKKRNKWTWKAAKLTPKGKPIPYKMGAEEE